MVHSLEVLIDRYAPAQQVFRWLGRYIRKSKAKWKESLLFCHFSFFIVVICSPTAQMSSWQKDKLCCFVALLSISTDMSSILLLQSFVSSFCLCTAVGCWSIVTVQSLGFPSRALWNVCVFSLQPQDWCHPLSFTYWAASFFLIFNLITIHCTAVRQCVYCLPSLCALSFFFLFYSFICPWLLLSNQRLTSLGVLLLWSLLFEAVLFVRL